MKRLLIGLLVVVVVALAACTSKSGTYTPPIATPNQNLPLYESGSQEASGEVGLMDETEASPSDLGEGSSKALISADPDIIHKYSSAGNYDSKVTVEDGVFKPSSTVTIWGEVADKGDISSPPWVYEADLDTKTDDVQLKANEKGGLEFWVRAGTSTGAFEINVGGTPAGGTEGKGAGAGTPGTSVLVFSGQMDAFTSDSWDKKTEASPSNFGKVVSVTITITE